MLQLKSVSVTQSQHVLVEELCLVKLYSSSVCVRVELQSFKADLLPLKVLL